MRLIKSLSLLIIFSLSAWAEEPTCIEALNAELGICNEPIVPEFEIENALYTIFYFDTIEEFRAATGETDPDVLSWSLCETKPDKNIAYCDLYILRAMYVDDNATTTFGHEVLHGLLGSYHKSGDE